MDLFVDTLRSHRTWFRDACLLAAFELGVIDLLRRRPCPPGDIAGALGLPGRRRLARLLDMLRLEGLLVAEDGGRLSPGADLVRPAHVGEAGWGALAGVVRADRPLTTSADEARAWQQHMRQVALRIGDALFDAVGPTGPSLLDLGSGTGALAEVFLRRDDTHRATLVDTPDVLAGVSLPCTELRPGDALAVDLGDARFDVVVLSHLLHLHDAPTAERLCHRAASLLTEGGRVVVRDFDLDADRTGPVTGVYFALNMALYTEAGDVHPPEHIADWLRDAGLTHVTVQRGPLGPDVVVIEATSPPPLSASPTSPPCGGEFSSLPAEACSILPTPGSQACLTTGQIDEVAAKRPEGPGEYSVSARGKRSTEVALPLKSSASRDSSPPLPKGGDVGEADRGGPKGGGPKGGGPKGGGRREGPAETGRHVRAELARRGMLHPDAPDFELSLPPMLHEMLTAALADADQALGDMLRMHYLEVMPRLLIEELCSTDPRSARLFHVPLDIWRLPRLRGALDALVALAERAGVAPGVALPTAFSDWCGGEPATLAQLYPHTHFGQCMPLLSTYPHDLATLGAELDAGRDVHDVIDDRLAASLVHELAHGPRVRQPLWPPYLDECLAGEIGERALPGLGWPRPGQPQAIFGTPWFAQVGLALVRAAGSLEAVVAAHLGQRPWDEVLPAGLPAVLARVGWQAHRDTPQSHLMGDILRPVAWVKLILLGAAGRLGEREWTLDDAEAVPMASLAADLPADDALDRLELRRALHTMLLHPVRLDTGAVRVRCEPPETPVVLDWRAGTARGVARGAALADPVHVLPPAVCRRQIEAGVEQTTVRITSADALEALTEALRTP